MIACLFLLVFLLLPAHLWAWGPIAHIDYAQEALRHLSAYGPLVKGLLGRFPQDFLYGALAADITVGKGYVDYLHNCHNWRVGFLILNEARDERQKAAAFGYLSHLAVDVVSHNYFVPYKTILSYPTRMLGHVYWEMRFDANRPKRIWNLAKKIGKLKLSYNDELFARVLRRTIFSFKTNRRIFGSVLILHRLRAWKTMMEKVHESSRFKLLEEDIRDYRKLAVESVVAFLKDPHGAPCTKVDPTGEAKRLYAKETRHELKRLTKRRAVTREQAGEFLEEVKTALRASLYRPADLPTVSDLFR